MTVPRAEKPAMTRNSLMARGSEDRERAIVLPLFGSSLSNSQRRNASPSSFSGPPGVPGSGALVSPLPPGRGAVA